MNKYENGPFLPGLGRAPLLPPNQGRALLAGGMAFSGDGTKALMMFESLMSIFLGHKY